MTTVQHDSCSLEMEGSAFAKMIDSKANLVWSKVARLLEQKYSC